MFKKNGQQRKTFNGPKSITSKHVRSINIITNIFHPLAFVPLSLHINYIYIYSTDIIVLIFVYHTSSAFGHNLMVLCEKTAADRFGVSINITPGDASLADCRMAYSFGDHLIEYLGPMGESMTPAGVQVGREDPNPTHKCPNTFFQEFEGW